MTELSDLTPELFEALVGQVFLRPLGEGGSLELTLTSVERRGPTSQGRRAFSLLFQGPADPILDHDVHPVTHPELGELQLFIGPVVAGGPGDHIDYEVVFA